MSDSNGLLLLWSAVMEVEGSDIEHMIIQARNRRNQSLKLLKSRESSVLQNGKRAQMPIRHSHNELEKCRRAHLRSCMERLKKVLKFDQDSAPCRVTMLNVLKKASSTIYARERSIHAMNIKETMAKNRFVELTNRLNNLQRQLKRLKNMQAIESAKAERIRNYSECSILTTSSDDSNVDNGRSRQLSIHFPGFYDQVSPVNDFKDEEFSKFYKLPAFRDDTSFTVGSHLYKCSSPNSNSCDSGFEESHINRIGSSKKSAHSNFVNNNVKSNNDNITTVTNVSKNSLMSVESNSGLNDQTQSSFITV